MKTLILAGGRGTRLQSVVSNKPKPLVDISGQPFLSYQFDYLLSQGITEATLSLGYMANAVIDTYGENYLGLSLRYLIEENPLGTGGAIHYAISTLKPTEKMLVLNGDTYFPVNLKEFENFHEKNDSDISVALTYMNDAARYGSVIQSDDSIESFSEKSIIGPGWINGGVYFINPSYFPLVSRFDKKFISFEVDVLSQQKSLNISINGFRSSAPFIDIGTPESLEAAKLCLKNWVIHL